MTDLLLSIIALSAITPIGAIAACPTPVVPAYFYSDTAWAQVSQPSGREHWLIANPVSGAGTKLDTNYQRWIRTAKANGHKVLGYIPTGYGTKTQTYVQRQAQNYKNWYGVSEFFLDEMSTKTGKIPYYSRMVTTIAPNGATVVLNPGTVPPEQFYTTLPKNASIVAFEDTPKAFSPTAMPTWLSKYANRTILLAYQGSQAEYSQIAAYAQAGGFLGAYGTQDGADGNPWDSVSSYWATSIQFCTQ